MTKDEQEREVWICQQLAAIREFDPTGADYFEELLKDAVEAEKTRDGEINAYCVVLKGHLREGRTLASKGLF